MNVVKIPSSTYLGLVVAAAICLTVISFELLKIFRLLIDGKMDYNSPLLSTTEATRLLGLHAGITALCLYGLLGIVAVIMAARKPDPNEEGAAERAPASPSWPS